eukprot:17732-Heterococcus_DN1.PRE.1
MAGASAGSVITGASGNALTIFSERETIERARSVGATAAGSSVGANVNTLHGSATNVVHAATSFMTTLKKTVRVALSEAVARNQLNEPAMALLLQLLLLRKLLKPLCSW